MKGAENTHLNLILIYQRVYGSLLTKLPGRMEQSPVSQRSNEPVTMEMSWLPLPAPQQARCSGVAPGKLAVPEGCGTGMTATPRPRWGGEAVTSGWMLGGCRARWLGAHPADPETAGASRLGTRGVTQPQPPRG